MSDSAGSSADKVKTEQNPKSEASMPSDLQRIQQKKAQARTKIYIYIFHLIERNVM